MHKSEKFAVFACSDRIGSRPDWHTVMNQRISCIIAPLLMCLIVHFFLCGRLQAQTAGMGLPMIITQPASRTVNVGDDVMLWVRVAPGPPVSFQWYRDGMVLPGETGGIFHRSSVGAWDSGTFTCAVSNANGITLSAPATLVVLDSGRSRLVNLSIRAFAGRGIDTLIIGWVLGGDAARGTTPWMLRAMGPSLGRLGVSGAIEDPGLAVWRGSAPSLSNEDWGGQLSLVETAARVGAFPFESHTSLDAALFVNFGVGSCTAHVTPSGANAGIALAELYVAELKANTTANTPRAVNLSARGYVGTGAEVMIAGFVISEGDGLSLLIRGIGPGLAAMGIPTALADPRIELYGAMGRIRSNDAWEQQGNDIERIFRLAQAFPLKSGSRDAAMVQALTPGIYTVVFEGVGNGTGTGLLEIFELP